MSNAAVNAYEIFETAFFGRKGKEMKKRFTKVLALGLTAVMIIGTPLSAVAAEITPTDVSVTSEATEDEQAVTDETAEETTACENSDSTEQTDDAADVAEAQEAQPEEKHRRQQK